ncbi:MAG: hypothetical protein AVDCRST_MAG19-710, partial [uncultured Thermomicrobiales bacterium]
GGLVADATVFSARGSQPRVTPTNPPEGGWRFLAVQDRL